MTNWNAVGAIGQWIGAAATVWAVITALNANKPKIKVDAFLSNHDKVKSIISNYGQTNVTIKYLYIRLPNKRKNNINVEVFLKGNLPQILIPGQTIELVIPISLFESSLKIGKFDLIYAQDGIGKRYYCKTSIFRKITRYFWWKFSN